MSLLNRLAQIASGYIRQRQRNAGVRPSPRPPSGGVSSSGPPPVQTSGGRGGARKPPIVGSGARASDDDDEEYDNIQLLGRDASYDEELFDNLASRMRQVSSSNIYGYGFEPESKNMGILYVTFLEYVPVSAGGSGERGSGPGPTYAYYNFPVAKFKQFERMAESSAGKAVWDYCRVRHSRYEHQHTYRLIQVTGDYVPRKVYSKGFRARAVPSVGIGRRGFQRSTLAPARNMVNNQPRDFARQLPNRGVPNRAAPNRGSPNRGR